MAMERYGVHGVRVYQLNNCEAFLVSVLARFSLGPASYHCHNRLGMDQSRPHHFARGELVSVNHEVRHFQTGL